VDGYTIPLEGKSTVSDGNLNFGAAAAT